MVRWMCGIKLQNRIPSKGLRESVGLDDIITVQQNRLQRHVLQKEDNDWVKKCMEYEVEGARPRGRPKKTWREIVEKDCIPLHTPYISSPNHSTEYNISYFNIALLNVQ